jgi:hypothetical protein
MRFLGPVALVIALLSRVTLLTAQTIPARDDSRHSLLRGVWLGLLPAHNAVPATQAGKVCVPLPKDEESEEIQSGHYTWTSVYTAEDSSRGAGARDTAAEEEVVLFKTASPDSLIPVWHGRFETGDHAIWRSVTPELAPARGGTLLSVMQCVNGTGGCSQEFLLRHPDGRWFAVWQAWLDQLPRGFEGRIRHGVRIDPKTLRGEAGLYGDRDPNCCPSQNLIIHLTVLGESLVLLRHMVQPAPKGAS